MSNISWFHHENVKAHDQIWLEVEDNDKVNASGELVKDPA